MGRPVAKTCRLGRLVCLFADRMGSSSEEQTELRSTEHQDYCDASRRNVTPVSVFCLRFPGTRRRSSRVTESEFAALTPENLSREWGCDGKSFTKPDALRGRRILRRNGTTRHPRARSPCLASVCRSSTTEAIFARLRKAKGGMPPPEMLFTTIVFRSASLASRHWTPRQFREFDLRSLRRVHNIRRNLP